MHTAYDVVSLAIFAGLIVIFLQRSTSSDADDDAPLFHYLIAGAGCATANYFGNNGQDAIAIALILGTVGFIFYFLKPFGSVPKA